MGDESFLKLGISMVLAKQCSAFLHGDDSVVQVHANIVAGTVYREVMIAQMVV